MIRFLTWRWDFLEVSPGAAVVFGQWVPLGHHAAGGGGGLPGEGGDGEGEGVGAVVVEAWRGVQGGRFKGC